MPLLPLQVGFSWHTRITSTATPTIPAGMLPSLWGSTLDVVLAIPLVLADSLTQVLDVASRMIDVVNPAHERKEAFVHLIFGILNAWWTSSKRTVGQSLMTRQQL
jgi:hypothetical protein